jgi:hypothetical protein
MRGADYRQSDVFSYLSAEAGVRKDHSLRAFDVPKLRYFHERNYAGTN